MIRYDPDKDQSERFGWKKWCDESIPTEQEQDQWAKIALGMALIVGLIVGLIGLAEIVIQRIL